MWIGLFELFHRFRAINAIASINIATDRWESIYNLRFAFYTTAVGRKTNFSKTKYVSSIVVKSRYYSLRFIRKRRLKNDPQRAQYHFCKSKNCKLIISAYVSGSEVIPKISGKIFCKSKQISGIHFYRLNLVQIS